MNLWINSIQIIINNCRKLNYQYQIFMKIINWMIINKSYSIKEQILKMKKIQAIMIFYQYKLGKIHVMLITGNQF